VNPRLLPFLSAALTLLLASCAALLGPRDVEIPLSTLQQAIARKFPFSNRYLELFDIGVSNPRIAMQPESNRVLTSMDVSFAPPFTNRSWNGSFAVSGQLKFDAARSAIVLSEPHVETFAINGLDMPYASQITKIGRLLAEELLRDAPLYTFHPEDLRRAGTWFTPSRITTTPRGLVVTLVPAG